MSIREKLIKGSALFFMYDQQLDPIVNAAALTQDPDHYVALLTALLGSAAIIARALQISEEQLRVAAGLSYATVKPTFDEALSDVLSARAIKKASET